MGLITGHEEIKSHEHYFFSMEIAGVNVMSDGVSDRNKALEFARTLKKQGITPKISRQINYDSTRSGYLTKKPETEQITVERLEEIVREDEPLPKLQWPQVSSTYRC